jgi:hypothetical protein
MRLESKETCKTAVEYVEVWLSWQTMHTNKKDAGDREIKLRKKSSSEVDRMIWRKKKKKKREVCVYNKIKERDQCLSLAYCILELCTRTNKKKKENGEKGEEIHFSSRIRRIPYQKILVDAVSKNLDATLDSPNRHLRWLMKILVTCRLVLNGDERHYEPEPLPDCAGNWTTAVPNCNFPTARR